VNDGAAWSASTFGPYANMLLGLGFDGEGGIHGLQFLSTSDPGVPGLVTYGSFDQVP
jgi:hypothetical protein